MRTLIVNLGPAGDIVRTTVLLREIKGEIYWLTKDECKYFLKSPKITKVFFLENKEDLELLKKIKFDLIISLNEEHEALKIVKGIETEKLIGVYLDENSEVKYTHESSYWFDMSLSSKFGKEKADELKLQNKKSVPQILIEMIGKEWKGQEYDLGIAYNKKQEVKGRIGLINVATGLWPNKQWQGYDELAELLRKEGHEAIFLGMRPSVKDHIKDIIGCELIVCGDTLGLHLALALKKKVVALFNCTSPDEIFDYGRMIKIVSPLFKEYFYKKSFDKRATEAIKVREVLEAVKKLLNT